MLPNNSLLISEEKRNFLYLNNLIPEPLVSYERGGFALGDPSLGLAYQVWSLKYEKFKFILTNELGFELVIKTLPIDIDYEVTKVSLAFDQNMKYIWGYSYKTSLPVEGSTIFSNLYWYNVANNGYEELKLKNTFDISLSLDDKRVKSNDINDVILSYINFDNWVCIRYQRDRYSIETALKKLPPNTIISKLGMTQDYRFQFELRTTETYKHTDDAFILGGL